MTDYYCNCDLPFADKNGDPDGGGAGTVYQGPGGLQAAIRGTGAATALVAGDTLYIHSEFGDLKLLVKLTCGKDVTGWTIGDAVEDNNGGGEWTGTLCETNVDATNTIILVELIGNIDDSNITLGSGINNTTAVDTTTLGAKATDGIQVDTNSGNVHAGTPIRVVGVNSSWVNDGTRAMLACGGMATNGLLVDDVNGWTFENFEIANAVGDGFLPSATDHVYYHSFLNCYVHDCGGDGWAQSTAGGAQFTLCLWTTCHSTNNVNGWDFPSTGHLAGCSGNDNSARGLAMSYAMSHRDCAFNNNATDGLHLYRGGAAHNCIMDGNADYGVVSAGGVHLVMACRITNNGAYGINVSSGLVWAPFNYINGNTSGRTNGSIIDTTWKGIETVLPAAHVTDKAAYGYADRGNGNWNLRLGAEGYRTEWDLDGTNIIRFARGLSTMPLIKPRG